LNGFEGLRIGIHTDRANRTGCTVVLPPPGTTGALAVRGGAPGTREAAALGPTGTVRACHAVVLCGSSLFGLAAAQGVVDWCVRRGRGLSLPAGHFPIVGAAVVQDLRDPGQRRIGAGAGYAACAAAREGPPPEGSVGAGTGCTVGKEAGTEWASKGGQGYAALGSGDLVVAAVVAVNALGSVLAEDGSVLAGCRAPAGVPRFPETSAPFAFAGGPSENTVIGCVLANARLDKGQAYRIADLAHTGIARSVSPAHTTLDGDALFVLATGRVAAPVDLVADLAARAVAAAVRSGVRAAEGFPERPADPRVRGNG
jgi:L-aminopeptidase/D-esterase-like protein